MYQLVHTSNIDTVWHLAAPWIAQAIGESDAWVEIDTIKLNLRLGNAKLWIGWKSDNTIGVVMVTEDWLVAEKKTLVLRWLCGKKMDEWFCDLEMIEGWAIANGYQGVHIWGRPGWLRLCKSLGYRHEATIISKPLIRGLH